MPSRIVTSTYRYKRPPRKRKAVPLEGPAIVRRGTVKSETPPAPANGDRKPAIVTITEDDQQPVQLVPTQHHRSTLNLVRRWLVC